MFKPGINFGIFYFWNSIKDSVLTYIDHIKFSFVPIWYKRRSNRVWSEAWLVNSFKSPRRSDRTQKSHSLIFMIRSCRNNSSQQFWLHLFSFKLSRGKGTLFFFFHDIDITVSFVSFLQTLIKSCYHLAVSCYSFLFGHEFVCLHCQLLGYDTKLLAAIPKYILWFGLQDCDM